MSTHHNKTNRARSLRQNETKSEKLLWSILRANQVCDLKFRRQHPVGPFFADFACLSKKLVVEIDGGYHDYVAESDLGREAYLIEAGWTVLRFSDKDVEDDPEAVAIAIVRSLGLEYKFRARSRMGSGMKRGKPSPAAKASDPPTGRVSD